MKSPSSDSLNVESCLNLIKQDYPDFNIHSWSIPKLGFDHFVLVINEQWIFRFPREEQYRTALRSESGLLNQISKRLPLQIPCYIKIAKDYSFGAYRLISGVPMTRYRYRNAPRAVKSRVIKQVAAFINALHKVPVSVAHRYHVRTQSRQERHERGIKDYQRIVRRHITREEQKLCLLHFKEFEKLGEAPRRVFTHNDFYQNHILMNPSQTKIVGVIDFSDRAIADPADDFAELWAYGSQFVKDVYSRYEGPKDDQLLARSIAGYRQAHLAWLRGALDSKPEEFSKAYRRLREIFSQKSLAPRS